MKCCNKYCREKQKCLNIPEWSLTAASRGQDYVSFVMCLLEAKSKKALIKAKIPPKSGINGQNYKLHITLMQIFPFIAFLVWKFHFKDANIPQNTLTSCPQKFCNVLWSEKTMTSRTYIISG